MSEITPNSQIGEDQARLRRSVFAFHGGLAFSKRARTGRRHPRGRAGAILQEGRAHLRHGRRRLLPLPRTPAIPFVSLPGRLEGLSSIGPRVLLRDSPRSASNRPARPVGISSVRRQKGESHLYRVNLYQRVATHRGKSVAKENGVPMAGNIDIRTKVGLRIKELRLESGMSQEDFANHIDMARSYFANRRPGKGTSRSPIWKRSSTGWA